MDTSVGKVQRSCIIPWPRNQWEWTHRVHVNMHIYERMPIWNHCNTLQHTATHCNTLQHTTTHCNTLKHNSYQPTSFKHSPAAQREKRGKKLRDKNNLDWKREKEETGEKCGAMEEREDSFVRISAHTATHCSTLQHTATHCNTLQHTAKHTATHCNTLHHTTLILTLMQV